jgi:Ankyrin repeats (3 copies)
MDIDENNPHRSPKRDLSSNADRELFQAVLVGDTPGVSAWLARGADVNARDTALGRTPLFHAVALPERKPAIAELLLARGADVRAHGREGETPLHVAAISGNEAQMRVLLDHRAEIDARDASGKTPLHNAATLARIDAASFLVSRGADVSLRNRNGETSLHLVPKDVEKHLREPFRRLLGGFLTAHVVEARPDSLIVRVETIHSKFPEAERQAKQCGTLTVPCGVFSERPHIGDLVRCEKGLTPGLDEAWSEARRKAELGIERER